MPHTLPPFLYGLAVAGRAALASLPCPSRRSLSLGLSRTSFLVGRIEAAANLPVVCPPASFWASLACPQRYRLRRQLFRVPGFCYARLFDDAWLVPAICALGPYPACANVARLSGYFCASADHYSAFSSGLSCRGVPVAHVCGTNRALSRPIFESLVGLSLSLASAAPGPGPADFPPLPCRPAVPFASSNAAAGPSRYFDLPPDPPVFPSGRVPPGVRRSAHTLPPRGLQLTGVGVPRGRGARMMPAPPVPFSVRGAERPSRCSPPPDPVSFKSATRDPFDDLLEQLKSALSGVPRSLADSIWHDFLSWLSSYRLLPTFSRLTSLPHIKSAFHSRLDSALASVKADEERAVALGLASDNLAQEVRRLSALEALEMDCGTGPVPGNLAADLAVARDTVLELSWVVDSLDAADEFPPASVADGGDAPDPEIHAPLGGSSSDPATVAAPTARAPAPWSESNYENFYARTASAFPAVLGKFPLSKLIVVMDSPIKSKLLMPRALEIYTTDELKGATARGVRPWLNRYEDPIEPCKSWSAETFQHIYSRDSFCFLLARVAQRDAQWRDRKLEKLRSALSSRWRVEVTIERVPPRHDWVLCSIPAVPAPGDLPYEILSAALLRLSDGNASYIVRHLAPLSTLRDLDVTIKGSIADPVSVFNQLKKKLLAYKSSGTFLGWRVTGVRPGNAVSKYRATFLLDSNRVSWPWTHAWDHPHGSLPASHTLLDFSPSWSAVKPYACQCCYNSDHFSLECPLAHIRLGGMPVISPVSLSLMLHKKPAERLVIVDRAFLPPSQPSDLAARATRAVLDNTPVPFESPAHPLPPGVSLAIDASFKFLSSKLHSIMHTFDGLSMELIHKLCSRHHGDVHMVLSNLASRSFDIPWQQDEIDREWSIFRRPGSGPTPRSSSPSVLADSMSPPRYLKLVQFVREILHPLPPVHPVPNLPEIVTSCHGDLQAIMRHLEVVYRVSVPPYSAASLNAQFSNWLIPTPSGHASMALDDVVTYTPAALPPAPAAPTPLHEEVTQVSPYAPAPPRARVALPPAPGTTSLPAAAQLAPPASVTVPMGAR